MAKIELDYIELEVPPMPLEDALERIRLRAQA